MCWCTRPLSRMNSLARLHSRGCANAILLFSNDFDFSKFFYYVPVKVGFSRSLRSADDFDDVAGFGADGSCCWVGGFDVGELVGFDVVLFEYFLCFFWF